MTTTTTRHLITREDVILANQPTRGTGRAPIDHVFDITPVEDTCDCGETVIAPGDNSDCYICQHCAAHYMGDDGHRCD